ncbi:MAG: NADP-dependent succinic semialdehyde dehydrogenase [Actinomycetota bacterium]|nr:NADP-dependent succinic semialdehyde dehydrogenase [Actinomycetota bacterium]
MAIASINPATGELLEEYTPLSPAQLDDRLARAAEAFRSYGVTPFDRRSEWMGEVADLMESEAPRLARTMTSEMGKTLPSSRAEVAKCVRGCRYYAARAESMLATREVDPAAVGARRAYVAYQPLGPVLAVMPWNFPMWQVMRFAAPALMAGNVALLKHASNVPRTALAIEDLFVRAGFPSDVFQTLMIPSGDVERVVRDDRVRAVTLTGSGPAGAAVASIAGSEVKPVVLELGGSDPFVVMPSADLEAAADTAVASRCQNNGQSCIAAKRFIVHQEVADEWTSLFADRMAQLKVGDPMAEGTDVGPLATETGRDDLAALVEDAQEKGARVVVGGHPMEGPGWFYAPTVVDGVTPEMRLFSEEAFGPVAQVHRVADIDQAIELANATHFGLGSNAWTNDPAEQQQFASRLDAGAVFVNGMTASFPEMPFGGVKKSGVGRELSEEGIRSFCNVKSVWIGGRQE